MHLDKKDAIVLAAIADTYTMYAIELPGGMWLSPGGGWSYDKPMLTSGLEVALKTANGCGGTVYKFVCRKEEAIRN